MTRHVSCICDSCLNVKVLIGCKFSASECNAHMLHRISKMARDPTPAILGRKRPQDISACQAVYSAASSINVGAQLHLQFAQCALLHCLTSHRPGEWLPDWQDTNICDDN